MRRGGSIKKKSCTHTPRHAQNSYNNKKILSFTDLHRKAPGAATRWASEKSASDETLRGSEKEQHNFGLRKIISCLLNFKRHLWNALMETDWSFFLFCFHIREKYFDHNKFQQFRVRFFSCCRHVNKKCSILEGNCAAISCCTIIFFRGNFTTAVITHCISTFVKEF